MRTNRHQQSALQGRALDWFLSKRGIEMERTLDQLLARHAAEIKEFHVRESILSMLEGDLCLPELGTMRASKNGGCLSEYKGSWSYSIDADTFHRAADMLERCIGFMVPVYRHGLNSPIYLPRHHPWAASKGEAQYEQPFAFSISQTDKSAKVVFVLHIADVFVNVSVNIIENERLKAEAHRYSGNRIEVSPNSTVRAFCDHTVRWQGGTMVSLFLADTNPVESTEILKVSNMLEALNKLGLLRDELS